MLIVLIGYRCSGKTSVGRETAALLRWKFVDSDAVIEKDIGQSIEELVAAAGWDAFREAEAKTITRLAMIDNCVLATGGGVIENPQLVAILRRQGILVWLRADIETIKQRMLKDDKTASQRPSLTGMGSVNEIETTLCRRTPLYEKAAHHVIDTQDKAIEEISREIVDLVGQKQ